jgi:hypothetical protein
MVTTTETRTISLDLTEDEAWQLRRAAQREQVAIAKMIKRCEANGWSTSSLERQHDEYESLAAKLTMKLAGEQLPLFMRLRGSDGNTSGGSDSGTHTA